MMSLQIVYEVEKVFIRSWSLCSMDFRSVAGRFSGGIQLRDWRKYVKFKRQTRVASGIESCCKKTNVAQILSFSFFFWHVSKVHAM